MISLDVFDYNDLYTRIIKLQSYAMEVLSSDNRFRLVDRSTLNLVQKERELQKSEQFIDGYVVQQSAAIGADYLLTGDFELGDMMLTVKMYSVAEKKVMALESVKLKKQLSSNFLSVKDPVVAMTVQLVDDAFPRQISVVEITQGKKEAKSLLIAGGSKANLQKGVELDIKVREKREVDGVAQEYFRTVGKGEVEKVEDQNFSILEVKKGGADIKALLDAGTKLFCTIIKK